MMCIAFPGRVVAVGPTGATVRTRDRERQASTLLHPDVRVGEWVLVSLGTIVERLTDAEAEMISETLLAAGGGAGGGR